MGKITFHDQVQKTKPRQTDGGSITQFFVRYSLGLIKSKEQAMLAMVVISLVALGIAAYIILNSTATVPLPIPSEY